MHFFGSLHRNQSHLDSLKIEQVGVGRGGGGAVALWSKALNLREKLKEKKIPQPGQPFFKLDEEGRPASADLSGS